MAESAKKNEHPCPQCAADQLVRITSKKNGNKYWVCDNDDCDYIVDDRDGAPAPKVQREPAPDDITCPLCGGGMQLVTGARNGDFFSCAQYSETGCRGSRDIMPDSDPPQPAPDCEKCGRPMRVRNGKKGKFLGCSGYKPDAEDHCDATREISDAA